MCDQVFPFKITEGIFQFHELDKQIMLRIELRGAHGAFKIKRQPFLNPPHPAALCQIHEQNQIKYDRRGQDAVAAEEIDLDLHGIAQPAENIDIVPAFFVVPTGRIIVDADFVIEILRTNQDRYPAAGCTPKQKV